jgi:DNA-binding CsgD family transcriptional regulator
MLVRWLLDFLSRPACLPVSQVRQLTGVLTGLRWVGLASVGIAGVIGGRTPLGPRVAQPTILLILWVATYNCWIMLSIGGASDRVVLRLARLATVFDLTGCLIFLAIYSSPETQVAPYVIIMIEAVAFDGRAGAILSIGVFAPGLVGLEWVRAAVYGLPTSPAEAMLWLLIILVAALLLYVVDRTLVTASQPASRQLPGQPFPIERPVDKGGSPLRLTDREREVLGLLAEGYSNANIANRLHLSENTIKAYVESLLSRLNVRNRTEAVAVASRMNLI